MKETKTLQKSAEFQKSSRKNVGLNNIYIMPIEWKK